MSTFGFARANDLGQFATKQDLERFATKDDLRQLEQRLDDRLTGVSKEIQDARDSTLKWIFGLTLGVVFAVFGGWTGLLLYVLPRIHP